MGGKTVKNTRQLNVIMLNLGEAMYPQDYLEDVIKKVQEAVSDMECNLVGCYKVMSEKDAGECSRLIEGSPVDLFILNFVSWHITPYVMHILKNYTHIPLLIWGIGGTTDKTGRINGNQGLALGGKGNGCYLLHIYAAASHFFYTHAKSLPINLRRKFCNACFRRNQVIFTGIKKYHVKQLIIKGAFHRSCSNIKSQYIFHIPASFCLFYLDLIPLSKFCQYILIVSFIFRLFPSLKKRLPELSEKRFPLFRLCTT